ncbi:hypothetical protein LCGC14_0908720 [marine sediment metagenome]|uniref:Uncharacterized protein n=1 Tax=marine sediment metagenome TaxID=412755 RepID=A0A0F9PF09_9ZZZZ
MTIRLIEAAGFTLTERACSTLDMLEDVGWSLVNPAGEVVEKGSKAQMRRARKKRGKGWTFTLTTKPVGAFMGQQFIHKPVTEVDPHTRVLSYIARIKSKAKKAYAEAYRTWLTSGQIGHPPQGRDFKLDAAGVRTVRSQFAKFDFGESLTEAMLAKKTKEEVNYRKARAQNKEKDERCGTCTFVRLPDKCVKVSGTISQDDICDIWKRGIADSLDEVLVRATMEHGSFTVEVTTSLVHAAERVLSVLTDAGIHARQNGRNIVALVSAMDAESAKSIVIDTLKNAGISDSVRSKFPRLMAAMELESTCLMEDTTFEPLDEAKKTRLDWRPYPLSGEAKSTTWKEVFTPEGKKLGHVVPYKYGRGWNAYAVDGRKAKVLKDKAAVEAFFLKESLDEANISKEKVLKLYGRLRKAAEKIMDQRGKASPISMQILGQLAKLLSLVKMHYNKTGAQAVRVFLEATNKSGFLSSFAVIAGLVKKYKLKVGYDGLVELDSIPESLDEVDLDVSVAVLNRKAIEKGMVWNEQNARFELKSGDYTVCFFADKTIAAAYVYPPVKMYKRWKITIRTNAEKLWNRRIRAYIDSLIIAARRGDVAG